MKRPLRVKGHGQSGMGTGSGQAHEISARHVRVATPHVPGNVVSKHSLGVILGVGLACLLGAAAGAQNREER